MYVMSLPACLLSCMRSHGAFDEVRWLRVHDGGGRLSFACLLSPCVGLSRTDGLLAGRLAGQGRDL